MNALRFEGGVFKPATIDFKIPEEGVRHEDWTAHMRSIGWDWRGTLPGHADEFDIKADIYDATDEGGEILVELLLTEPTEYILCDFVNYFPLLTQYVYPIVNWGEMGKLMDLLGELARCLLDEEHGLELVQEVHARDYRLARQERAERNAAKAAKAAKEAAGQ